MVQTVALPAETLHTRVIARRKDFDTLFQGFTSLRAISYVASPDLLLQLLRDHGLSEIEVVVGESLTVGRPLHDRLRQDLTKKDLETLDQLAAQVERGAVRILVPSRPVHTKLYLLIGDRSVRVLQSSANLTLTAQQATNQMNYALWFDLPPDHPWLSQVTADYNRHLEISSLFMGDLMELLAKAPEERRETLEAWLRGTVAEPDPQAETRSLFQSIAAHALAAGQSQERHFVVNLPAAPPARREAVRLLAPLGPVMNGNHASLDRLAYVQYVQQTISVPLMTVDTERREVRIGIDGTVVKRTERPESPSDVTQALAGVEFYVNTVDWGKALDKPFAKASMFEALLYLLAAPFAHEHMKGKRSRMGLVDKRGPRFLYVYGASQNGKSTFLRFALKLLTGHIIDPLPGKDFGKRKVGAAALTGTAFPLVFDDVDTVRKREAFDDVVKGYWEDEWTPGHVAPQIVFTSNVEQLREAAKTRIKRVDFDIQFADTDRHKEELNRLLREDNPLFTWFSALYFDGLERVDPGDEELSIARQTLRALYDFSGRQVPSFLPNRPIEELFDHGRRAWSDVLFGIKKAARRKDGARLYIDFLPDVEASEVNAYRTQLPQNVKTTKRGNTIVVDNPDDFDAWLNGSEVRQAGFLDRVRGLFPSHKG